MANQRLFVNDPVLEPTRVGNSISTSYTYDGDKLTVFWKRETVEKTGIKPGDGLIISCYGDTPSIKKLGLPHQNADLLMWLCSFNKEARAHSLAEYQKLLEQRRPSFDWWGYSEWEIKGEGYAFTLCNRCDCGGVNHVAAYIDRPVTRAMVKEVLLKWKRGVYFPREFVEKVLRNRFGFTEADLTEITPILEH